MCTGCGSLCISHSMRINSNTTTSPPVPMFSSLLPPPKQASVATIKVLLPKKAPASKALVLPQDAPALQTTLQYGRPAPRAQISSSLEDTIPLKVKFPLLKHHFPKYTLRTCPDESLARCVEETRAVIDCILASADGEEPASSSIVQHKSTSLDSDKTTTIEIATYKEDPMLPPKFKLRKNREKPPPPPQPVLKAASTEKVTKELKDKWHIPSAVSNWKNNQGFAIALDKRVQAASGGSIAANAELNYEKFGQLSLALEHADKTAREELTLRNQQRKEAALREQAEKERKLESLLQKSKTLNYKRSGDYERDSRKKPRN